MTVKSESNFGREIMSEKIYNKSGYLEMIKVNWFDEELDQFYDTDKDNKGLIWGIEYYDGVDKIDMRWFKTEDERDKAIENDS
tara:strand:- start:3 stop:251 length:249 start_codon:yes stop_codon:yes gene_type:complete